MKTGWLILLPLLTGGGSLAQAEGEIAWRHQARQAGVTLTANPLGAVARTAFYVARGFSAEMIRPYAESCGFSFGMRNEGGTAIQTHLADWRALGADGGEVALRLPEAWDSRWEQAGVSQPARIAFRWAQFQTENSFAPGDWIMGMATLESVPAPPFRLVARYQDQEGNHEIVLDQLDCADD